MSIYPFLFPLQHVKGQALQNTQVGVLRMAFRARKVVGTFEERAPGSDRVLFTYFFSFILFQSVGDNRMISSKSLVACIVPTTRTSLPKRMHIWELFNEYYGMKVSYIC